jgi:hypothetical protein
MAEISTIGYFDLRQVKRSGECVLSFGSPMKVPRFSLRELLMLMVICALSMPYIYSSMVATRGMDLGWETVRRMVMKVEPRATLLGGNGGNDHVELTCHVPAENSEGFFPKLHVAIKEHIDGSGWIVHGSSTSSVNGNLFKVRYDILNGYSRCTVVAILLDKKEGKDWRNGKDVDEVRFIVLSPHTR